MQHAATNLGVYRDTQNTPYGSGRHSRYSGQIPRQIGGSRARVATSDRHAVRLAFQSASALIAD